MDVQRWVLLCCGALRARVTVSAHARGLSSRTAASLALSPGAAATGGEYTPVDNMLNPFWFACAEMLPTTMAPNLVTL